MKTYHSECRVPYFERNKMKLSKKQVKQCILSQLDQCNFNLNEFHMDFSVRGLHFEPNMFIRTAEAGLSFGYYGVNWHGPSEPVMTMFTHHTLCWELLNDLDENNMQNEMIESMFRVIDFRKRQYQKCKFCSDKVPPEHRFDERVCHTCASEQFGVVY